MATVPVSGGIVPFLPVPVETGERLYNEFLAGRSPNRSTPTPRTLPPLRLPRALGAQARLWRS